MRVEETAEPVGDSTFRPYLDLDDAVRVASTFVLPASVGDEKEPFERWGLDPEIAASMARTAVDMLDEMSIDGTLSSDDIEFVTRGAINTALDVILTALAMSEWTPACPRYAVHEDFVGKAEQVVLVPYGI